MRPWKLQQMTSEDPNFAASQDPQTWNTLKHRHWKLSKGVGVVFNLPGAPGCDKSFWFSNSNEYLNIFIKKNNTNEYPNIFNTNEYPNIFVSTKLYQYDKNKYLYRKIFKYLNTLMQRHFYLQMAEEVEHIFNFMKVHISLKMT